MNKSLAILAIVSASCVMGADNKIEIFAHNDSVDAHSYITVGADYSSIYDSITFDIYKTDWWYGTDRPRGTVGYFTYDPNAPENSMRGLIPEDAKSFTVNNLTPSTQISFYTEDGGAVEGGTAKATEELALIEISALKNQEIPDEEVGYYIADFDTVRDPSVSDISILKSGTGYHLDDYGFIDSWTMPGGATGGYGRDWMGFKPRMPLPTGAPLPGALAVMFVGGLAASALKLRKCRS